jgi:beta-lactamase regulating signal transducer with metallopeptidase domain
MTEALINHLWQSTLFGFAAAMLTLAFRNDGANTRFHIWLAASVKFLIPFPLCVYVGKHLRWETAPIVHATPELSLVIDQIAQPGAMMTTGFPAPPLPNAPMHWDAWAIILAIWSIVSAALICCRLLQWTKLRAVVKASSPLSLEAPIPVRQTATALEPGIFGIFRPMLLLPEGIVTHLEPEQLNTIVAHELCHWRRRDNLTAAIHMIVEALFWFHPLVWWLGNRMLVERERACDEAVVRSGNARQVYAEGILKVCQLYVGPPPPCVAGVSGGSLRKRIEQIMTDQMLVKLSFTKKCLLAVTGFAAIAGPFAAGLAGGPPASAQAAALVAAPPAIAQAQERMAYALVPSASEVNDSKMKHYKSVEWNFELDIPTRWNSFPAGTTNSHYEDPFEVIRFDSREDGNDRLIVFRMPYDPQRGLMSSSHMLQNQLRSRSFVTGEATIGSSRATLDFDRPIPGGGTWSFREYLIVNGTLVYHLVFRTNKRDADAMFDLYDQMAKSFVSDESPD